MIEPNHDEPNLMLNGIKYGRYYLGGKNLPARLHAYLRLESINHQKIGEAIKALQICKRSTQTASL